MQKDLDSYLKRALIKLEEAQKKIEKKQSYSNEAKNMNLVRELIKEQIKNENSNSTAR